MRNTGDGSKEAKELQTPDFAVRLRPSGSDTISSIPSSVTSRVVQSQRKKQQQVNGGSLHPFSNFKRNSRQNSAAKPLQSSQTKNKQRGSVGVAAEVAGSGVKNAPAADQSQFSKRKLLNKGQSAGNFNMDIYQGGQEDLLRSYLNQSNLTQRTTVAIENNLLNSISNSRAPVAPGGILKHHPLNQYGQRPNTVSDYLTSESTDDGQNGNRSALENQRALKGSYSRPELLQASQNMRENSTFYSQHKWPQGSLAFSTIDITNRRTDVENLKEETKSILLMYMDPEKTLHGRQSASIPSREIQEIGIIVPTKEQIIPFMQKRCQATTDVQDLYDMILIAIDKIQYVIKTIQQNGIDFALVDIIDQAVNLAGLEFKMIQRQRGKVLSTASNLASTNNFFKENAPNSCGADPTLLSDLDFLSTNLKEMTHESKDFQSKEKKKMAQFQLQVSLLQAQEQIEKDMEKKRLAPRNKAQSALGVRSTSNNKKQMTNYNSENYQLLMKYLKAWWLYVAQKKQSRNQKQYLETQIMSTIHMSDMARMQKVYRALYINKLRRERYKQITVAIEKKRNRNIERKFLKLIVQKFHRRKRLKDIKLLINRYRSKRLLKNSLNGWNRVVFQIRHEQLTLFEHAMIKARYAPEILLEKIAAPYFLSAINSNDCQNILNLHALAHTQFRISDKRLEIVEEDKLSGYKRVVPGPIRLRKHNVSLFQRTVEHILQYKQLRVLDALKRYIGFKKEFEKKRNQRIVRHVLLQLVYHRDINRLLKTRLEQLRQRNVKEQFVAFKNQIDKQIQNRNKFAILEKKHKKLVQKKLFDNWYGQFNYFYRIEHGQTTIEEHEADLFYINRYFQIYKQYYKMRMAKKPAKQRARVTYRSNNLKKCFFALADYMQAKKSEKRKIQKVQALVKRNFEKKYFDAYLRIHFLVWNQKKFYATNLKIKVLKSLRKRLIYREIKAKIHKMGTQKYQDTLKKKVIACFHRNRAQRLEFRAIVIGYEAGFSKMMMAKALRGLRMHAQKNKTKRMQLKYIDRLNTGNSIQKCFTSWHLYARRKYRIRMAYQAIKSHREQKIKQQNLIKMLIKFNRGKLLQQQFQEVNSRYSARIAGLAFRKWLRRYQKLRQTEQLYTEMRELQTRQDLFNLWRAKLIRRISLQEKMKAFEMDQKRKLMQEMLTNLKQVCRAKAHRKEMEKLCTSIFMNNQMKKTFKILRYNRYFHITKRVVPTQYTNKVKAIFFKAIQTKWAIFKPAIENQKRLKRRMLRAVFKELKARWSYNKQVRMNIIALMTGKVRNLTLQCFMALKNWRERKRELIRKNLPIYYLEEETFRAQRALRFWRVHHQNMMRIKRAGAIVEKKQRKQLIAKHLDVWLVQLHKKVNWEYKAVPFYEKIIQSNYKKQAFRALVKHMHKKQQQKEIFQKAFEFYRYQLLLKTMRVLMQNYNDKTVQKNKIQYMVGKRNQRIKIEFVEALLMKLKKTKKYRPQYEFIKKENEQNLRDYYFILWYRHFYQQQQLKPQVNMVTKFYATTLQKRCLRRLYNYRTMQLLKKNMKNTADNYYQENLLKKVLEILLVHSYKYKTKNAMRKLATLHYKRNVMLKWYYLSQQKLKSKRTQDNLDIGSIASKRSRMPESNSKNTGNKKSSQQPASEYLRPNDMDQIDFENEQNPRSEPRSDPKNSTGPLKSEKQWLTTSQSRYGPSQKDLEEQADAVSEQFLLRRALRALREYTDTKLAEYHKEMEARTQYNLSLKQKTFFALALRADKKGKNRQAVRLFQTLQKRTIKKKVFTYLMTRFSSHKVKSFQGEIAQDHQRQRMLETVLKGLRGQVQLAKIADKLRVHTIKQTQKRYFKAWLRANNQRILGRLQIGE